MKKTSYIAVLLALSILALGGCRSNPVLNIEQSPVTVITAKTSAESVKTSIIRATRSLGWTVKEVAPGHLEATLRLRAHVAVVDIKYSAKEYSILYKDSANLNYDGVNIHSNYNSWIQNLDRNIQIQLDTM